MSWILLKMMDFTSFGEKFNGTSGILQLMDDLGQGVGDPGTIMLGGGNPSSISEVHAYFESQMRSIVGQPEIFQRLIGTYASPRGHTAFIEAFVELVNGLYHWGISSENVVLTNGSQIAFFYLFNLFGGESSRGFRKILLPLTPEYIGYEDLGLSRGIFASYRPVIELLHDNLFKYRVDFNALTISPEIGALCVSRPTNPTGNVLTEDEIEQLSVLAESCNIPLIIDNAYGAPFPGIIFSEIKPRWNPSIVMCLSLSKLGLPGIRTGIIVARKEITRRIANMNAIISLSPGNIGPGLSLKGVQSGDILRLCREVIRPHYKSGIENAIAVSRRLFRGLDFRIHVPEGSILIWIWFPALRISTQELYVRVKRRGVLIVPGHYFFPGLENDAWDHKSQCIRINVGASPEDVEKGLAIIAEEVRDA